jgi:hypothetical protein
MTRITIYTALSAMLANAANAEPVTTFKNDRGQVTGQGTTRGNVTTFEDNMGRDIGRAERGRDGTIRFFNEKGQSVGSAREKTK